MIIILIALALGVYSLYLMYFDANPPIVFNNQNNLEVVDLPYKAGDMVQIHSSGCVYTNSASRIAYTIIDTQKYLMPELFAVGGYNFKGKCFDDITYRQLPVVMPSGKYYIQFLASYRVNPLAIRYVEARTERFKVQGRDLQGRLLPPKNK